MIHSVWVNWYKSFKLNMWRSYSRRKKNVIYTLFWRGHASRTQSRLLELLSTHTGTVLNFIKYNLTNPNDCHACSQTWLNWINTHNYLDCKILLPCYVPLKVGFFSFLFFNISSLKPGRLLQIWHALINRTAWLASVFPAAGNNYTIVRLGFFYLCTSIVPPWLFGTDLYPHSVFYMIHCM